VASIEYKQDERREGMNQHSCWYGSDVGMGLCG